MWTLPAAVNDRPAADPPYKLIVFLPKGGAAFRRASREARSAREAQASSDPFEASAVTGRSAMVISPGGAAGTAVATLAVTDTVL